MKLLYIDVETTGLDFSKDRVIEMGFGFNASEIYSQVLKQTNPLITQEITEITGLSQADVDAGKSPRVVMEDFLAAASQADFIVAHNARGFDRPMVEAELKWNGLLFPQLKWIDTLTDLGIPPKYKCKKLSHLCLDHGMKVDPDRLHRTEGDIYYMIGLCNRYDMEKAAALSQEPLYVIRAIVSFDNNKKAKDRGYRWQTIGNRTYNKSWVKQVRKSELQSEIDLADFQVKILEESHG